MFGTQLTRSNRNFRLFGMLAPSIVLVSMLSCKCVVALTVVTISQKAHTVSGIVRFQDNGQTILGARGRIVRKEDTYVVLGSDQASRSERTKPQYLFITDKNGK